MIWQGGKASGTKEQRGEDVAEKRMRLFAQEVMPALDEILPQPLQTATSTGKRCVQTIWNKEEVMVVRHESAEME